MTAIDLSAPGTSDYTGQTFKKLQQRGATLHGKEFVECVFSDCDFYEANFEACKFFDCTFTRCDLSLARVTGCRVRGTTFARSKLVGINWSQAQALQSVTFDDCALNHGTFMGVDLRQARLTRCVAREADFGEADLTRADCTSTDFAGARFLHTNLTRADFTRATRYYIDPSLNTLQKTKFSLPEAVALLLALDIVLEGDRPEGLEAPERPG